MGKVIIPDFKTTLDVSVERVLDGAAKAGLTTAIIIGEAGDGPYHASTTSDIPTMLLMIEMFKRGLIDRAYAGKSD